jgi:hypothetical protein
MFNSYPELHNIFFQCNLHFKQCVIHCGYQRSHVASHLNLRYLLKTACLKARLHRSPRLINAVESMKLNSTVERYCLHSSTKVNEAVDLKMAANELVREGVVVICDYLMEECQHILEKINKRKKRPSTRSTLGNRS